MSAWPSAMTCSAPAGSVMPPVAITGTLAPFAFTSAARSTSVFGLMYNGGTDGWVHSTKPFTFINVAEVVATCRYATPLSSM